MFEDIFRHKKAIAAKLEAYGFRRIGGVFRYDRDILNGEFHLEIINTGRLGSAGADLSSH